MKEELKYTLMVAGMVFSWSIYYAVSKVMVSATGSALLAGFLLRAAALVFLTAQLLLDGSFSRLFHQVTGETLSDYVSAARVRRANELLRDSANKIGDIGEAVGFSSSANFSRFYRKMMGCTPQEYRDGLGRNTLHNG